jgi:hypothetical protein
VKPLVSEFVKGDDEDEERYISVSEKLKGLGGARPRL